MAGLFDGADGLEDEANALPLQRLPAPFQCS